MARIRAFRGLRPVSRLAQEVSELPYDVVNTQEAREIAGSNANSFYHVIKPEIDLPEHTDPYSDEVYEAGRKNLEKLMNDNVLIQDEEPSLYVYTQIMNGRPQTGLMTCVSIDDYLENRIKKHELTREDKENDRTRHLDTLNANTGLVFLLYNEDGTKRSLFEKAQQIEPEYDFTAPDGITHILRKIDDPELVQAFTEAFKNDTLYIADGHHRAASATRVGKMRREANPSYTGDEEYNWFLTVIFPHDQLRILSYNRVVSDLNGMEPEDFLKALAKDFTVKKEGVKIPSKQSCFSMYLSGEWYTLEPGFSVSDDPIDGLDVKILQDRVLEPILGIGDIRTDSRINFIGGIRGTEELERVVDSDAYSLAFSMFPTTVDQLMRVSDNDAIMPPKSTWFEPKLRSGLVVHLLD